MNPEVNSSLSSNSKNININFDEFLISEDNFKPMTKGLGFHQETKKNTFIPSPRENKHFKKVIHSNSTQSLSNALKEELKPSGANGRLATGLEAFYATTTTLPETNTVESPKIEKNATSTVEAAIYLQFVAWIIDIAVILSFVVLTGTLLVLASGIEFKMYTKLISTLDLAIFTGAIFSIYYLLYFTILELSATPGKTIVGIKLKVIKGKELTVKHTGLRALISLVSAIALFLPNVLDFQGRLSETKVVK